MITWQSFSIWPSASEEMVSARTTSTPAASEATAHLQQFNEDTYWDTLGIMESTAASIAPEQLYHYTFVSFHRTHRILAPFLPSLNYITVKQEPQLFLGSCSSVGPIPPKPAQSAQECLTLYNNFTRLCLQYVLMPLPPRLLLLQWRLHQLCTTSQT